MEKENRDPVSRLEEMEKKKKGLDDGLAGSFVKKAGSVESKENRATNFPFEIEKKVNKQWGEEVERRVELLVKEGKPQKPVEIVQKAI